MSEVRDNDNNGSLYSDGLGQFADDTDVQGRVETSAPGPSDLEDVLDEMDVQQLEARAAEGKKAELADIDVADADPEFKDREPISVAQRACKTCNKQAIEATMIDGECLSCALKHLRRLESRLVQVGAMPSERQFCALDGHRAVVPNKLLPEYNGKITVNGIELYPVFPLCNRCLDTVSAYFVHFLEQRGFLRKGSKHIKNPWGSPVGVKLTKAEELQARDDLQKFIQAIELYVYQKESPVNAVYQDLMSTKKYLMLKKKDELLRKRKAELEADKRKAELEADKRKELAATKNDNTEERSNRGTEETRADLSTDFGDL